jgi:hypothetical protein
VIISLTSMRGAVVATVAVVALLIGAGAGYFVGTLGGNAHGGTTASSGSHQGKRLVLRTLISQTISNNSTVYSWTVMVWNNGTAPIGSISATLDTSSANYTGQGRPMQPSYTMNAFIIAASAPPVVSGATTTAPLVPYVAPDRPLESGGQASSTVVILTSPPYLQEQHLPVTISLSFVNGTISSFALSTEFLGLP